MCYWDLSAFLLCLCRDCPTPTPSPLPHYKNCILTFPLPSPRKYCHVCVVFAALPPKKHTRQFIVALAPSIHTVLSFVFLCRVCAPAPSVIHTNIKSLLPPFCFCFVSVPGFCSRFLAVSVFSFSFSFSSFPVSFSFLSLLFFGFGFCFFYLVYFLLQILTEGRGEAFVVMCGCVGRVLSC